MFTSSHLPMVRATYLIRSVVLRNPNAMIAILRHTLCALSYLSLSNGESITQKYEC